MLKRISTFISILVLFSLILTSVAMAQGPVQESADAFFSGGPKHITAADVFQPMPSLAAAPSTSPLPMYSRI
ncbi:MAG: hypothetical protein B6243_14155 [Anaerolineaceae bacterium 4572_5.2]|nr:MAG: hypothetical protein B6243_14155 [Anaerolineaceae bacterium 4572_5.2]